VLYASVQCTVLLVSFIGKWCQTGSLPGARCSCSMDVPRSRRWSENPHRSTAATRQPPPNTAQSHTYTHTSFINGQKGLKACIAVHGYPSQSYGAPPAIRDHTCHLTQVNVPALTQTRQAGSQFTYPGGIEGWGDPGAWLSTNKQTMSISHSIWNTTPAGQCYWYCYYHHHQYEITNLFNQPTGYSTLVWFSQNQTLGNCRSFTQQQHSSNDMTQTKKNKKKQN